MSSVEETAHQVKGNELLEKDPLQSGGEAVQLSEPSEAETLSDKETEQQVERIESTKKGTVPSGEKSVQLVERIRSSEKDTSLSCRETEQQIQRMEPSEEEIFLSGEETQLRVQRNEPSEKETLLSGGKSTVPVSEEDSQTDEETVIPRVYIQKKKQLLIFVVVVSAAIFGMALVLKFGAEKGSPPDQAYQNPHQSAHQLMSDDCEDPIKVIQPENTECEEESDPCFKCQETIPSAGFRDLSDDKTCENYTTSNDGKVLYIKNKSFSEEDILNGTVHPFGKEEKKYTQTCCILNRMRSKSQPCSKDYEYKCTEYDSDPECRCKKDIVCAGNSTITVPCKCFWSSCSFVDQKKIEECRNTTKEPEFKLCLLLFSNFKCLCKNETADEKLPLCSASENKVPYHSSQQKGSNDISWKGSVWFLTLCFCILTYLFIKYCQIV